MTAQTKALEFFKDWTNYLLVTTVALLGWLATSKELLFWSKSLRAECMVALAVSIAFGIFTLALIPLVQEQRRARQSNYDVRVSFALLPWRLRLKAVCFPQHVTFIYGIVVLVLGTITEDPPSHAQAIEIGTCGLAAITAIAGAAAFVIGSHRNQQ